jgi:hypothetical protein
MQIAAFGIRRNAVPLPRSIKKNGLDTFAQIGVAEHNTALRSTSSK